MDSLALACEIAAKQAEEKKNERWYNPNFPEALYRAAKLIRKSKLSVGRNGTTLIVEPDELKRTRSGERVGE